MKLKNKLGGYLEEKHSGTGRRAAETPGQESNRHVRATSNVVKVERVKKRQ